MLNRGVRLKEGKKGTNERTNEGTKVIFEKEKKDTMDKESICYREHGFPLSRVRKMLEGKLDSSKKT